MRYIFRNLIATAACLVTPAAAAQSEFHFTLPPGWRDLSPGTSLLADGIPQDVMAQAVSGRYVAFAVDPGDSYRVKASFNAIENPTTGRINEKVLSELAAEASKQAAQQGLDWSTVEMKMVAIGKVPVGRTISLLNTAQGSMKLVQYVVPGRKRSVILTYGCPVVDFDRYRPVFESAAMGTGGAYEPGGIDWERAFFAGGLGGLVAAVLSALQVMKKRAAKASPSPAAAPGPPSAPAWECPGCHRRVPGRIAKCHCGTLRPA